MTGDPWRIGIIVELLVLMFCAGYLHTGYARALPRVLYVLGFAYGSVLMLGALAVVANMATDVGPSPTGTRVLAVVLAPVAGVVAVLTVWALRSRNP